MAKRTVGFRFSEETLEALGRIAAERGLTRTAMLDKLICDEACTLHPRFDEVGGGQPRPKQSSGVADPARLEAFAKQMTGKKR